MERCTGLTRLRTCEHGSTRASLSGPMLVDECSAPWRGSPGTHRFSPRCITVILRGGRGCWCTPSLCHPLLQGLTRRYTAEALLRSSFALTGGPWPRCLPANLLPFSPVALFCQTRQTCRQKPKDFSRGAFRGLLGKQPAGLAVWRRWRLPPGPPRGYNLLGRADMRGEA